MKKILLTSILWFLFSGPALVDSLVWAQSESNALEPRGSTDRIREEPELIYVGDAPVYSSPKKSNEQRLSKPNHVLSPLSKTYDVDLYIPAGKYFAVQFDNQNTLLNPIYPEYLNPFSSTIRAAIDKAPKWMANDLITIFSLLESPYQNKWAGAILKAEDPYIDEIAFCIAHLSPQYLMSAYASVELLELNAKLIYENDKYLNYVEVVDYGSSQTDPDYYSTTKYRKAKYTDTTEVEVPKEIYYWYIVHPKITDEIPAFIDPDIIEDNYSHANNITLSDKGRFWRELLFYDADPGYARFKDMIRGSKVVWNEFSGTPGTSSAAVNVMNRWLEAGVQFTSNDERPHQPVRIYRKHMGRCGEFGDMRVAIARSALIPTTSVATYSRDHVWNEFWDENWIHWDGVIDDPLMYVDDWGKELNSVFRWRSDGSFSSVTETYTRSHAVLNIYVLDSLDSPIDGATVILYAPGLYQDKAFDNYGTTDKDGKVTFIVGAGRSYWARMECDYGSVPSGEGQVLRVISNSQDNEEYSVYMRINTRKPVFSWEALPLPQFNDSRYYLEIDVKVPFQILCARDLFDDLNKRAYQFIKKENGKINFFITDEPNYESYLSGKDVKGYHSFYESGFLSDGIEFDGLANLYCIFDNSNALHTLQHVVGSISLYSVYDPDISAVRILTNYPNPVNPQVSETTIMYQLPQKSTVVLAIYDILGQKVKTLLEDVGYAGKFSIDWDGRNEHGQLVSSGIYLCKIITDQGSAARKMMVIR